MIEDENKLQDSCEKEFGLKDEVYPYPDNEDEPVYESDISYDKNMERAKSVDIARNTYVYTNAEDSLNENMSTAWSFLGIGIAGTIFTLLNLLGVLNIMQGFLQKGVSLVLFIGFIFYALMVLRSKKEMIAKVEKEKEDRKKYTDWMKEKFTEDVLSKLGSVGASAEELELIRINFMSEELVRHFPEINPNFADRLAEDFFEEKA